MLLSIVGFNKMQNINCKKYLECEKQFCSACNYENPFYFNYVFTKKDINRCVGKLWHYPRFWFKTTYVQICGGYVFYFRLNDVEIFLIKIEEN